MLNPLTELQASAREAGREQVHSLFRTIFSEGQSRYWEREEEKGEE